MAETFPDDILYTLPHNALSANESDIHNVFQHIMLDMQRKRCYRRSVAAHIEIFLDFDALTKRLLERLVSSSSFKADFGNFYTSKNILLQTRKSSEQWLWQKTQSIQYRRTATLIDLRWAIQTSGATRQTQEITKCSLKRHQKNWENKDVNWHLSSSNLFWRQVGLQFWICTRRGGLFDTQGHADQCRVWNSSMYSKSLLDHNGNGRGHATWEKQCTSWVPAFRKCGWSIGRIYWPKGCPGTMMKWLGALQKGQTFFSAE